MFKFNLAVLFFIPIPDTVSSGKFRRLRCRQLRCVWQNVECRAAVDQKVVERASAILEEPPEPSQFGV